MKLNTEVADNQDEMANRFIGRNFSEDGKNKNS